MSFTSRRDVNLIVGAKAVSWLGDVAAMVALTLRIQGGGGGAGAIAALLVANLLPIVLLSGVVGRLLDRHENRRLLVASGLAQTALCTALAFTSATPAVLGLVALLGAGAAVNGAAWQALLPSAAGVPDLPAAIGRAQAAVTVAGVVAPPVGGLLTGWYGPRVPLLVDAATFLAVVAAASLLRTCRAALAGTGRQRGGLPIVWHDALLRPLFVLLGVFVLLASMVNVVEVFLIRETLGASAVWYGVAGAVFSLGMLGGALAGGRLRGPSRLAPGFVLACTALAVGLTLIGLAPSIGWLLPCSALVGVGNGVLNVTLSSLVMGRAREAERGRVGALLSGVASGMQLVAFVVGGALAGPFTPREIFVAAGVLGLLAPVALGRPLLRAAIPSPVLAPLRRPARRVAPQWGHVDGESAGPPLEASSGPHRKHVPPNTIDVSEQARVR